MIHGHWVILQWACYHTYKKPINYVWYLSISLVTTGIVVLRPPLFPS